MDTSKVFVKMCDCPEIRSLIQGIIEADHKRKVETEERFADTKYSVRIPDIRTPDVSVYNEDGRPIRRIDLLSQDQIQEMMKKLPRCSCMVCLTIHLNEFLNNHLEGLYEKNIDTMEQLWLAFYMSEKHQKFWDSKKQKWIKSE